jgi:hypothetical protein
VDTTIRSTDIPKVAAALGGDKLYGSDQTAAIREIIQNSLDAIQARKLIEDREENWGNIALKLHRSEGESWLTVEDNGVGMSEYVLTEVLLDFGKSLWRSSEILEQFPSLLARGMRPRGQFGIGFFSAFMLGDFVRVTTRRCDQGLSTALTLTFSDGLNARPILTHAPPERCPKDGGTRIEIKLKTDPRRGEGNGLSFRTSSGSDVGLFHFRRPDYFQYASLAELVAQIAPCSPVTIQATQSDVTVQAVSAGDWLTIAPQNLIARAAKSAKASAAQDLIRPISEDSGLVVGRAALFPAISYNEVQGALVSAGLRVQGVSNIAGVITGEIETAARNVGQVRITPKALQSWGEEQRSLIERMGFSSYRKALAAELLMRIDVDPGKLPIIQRGANWLNIEEFASILREENRIFVYLGIIDAEDFDPVGRDDFERGFEPNDRLFVIPKLITSVNASEFIASSGGSYLEAKVRELLDEVWTDWLEADDDDREVGTVDESKICRCVMEFRRDN